VAEEGRLKSLDALREKMGLPEKGPRADGRHNDEIRPVSIETGFHRPHQVLISCGDTKVICSASLENRVPQWRYGSGLGWLTAEYSMLPGATDKRTQRERGTIVSGRTQEIQRLIGRSLRNVVKLAGIGQCTIHIDCDVISADGGTRTASITGGFLALYSLIKASEKRFAMWPIIEPICAVSVGIVGGVPLLDLDYKEDSNAQVDGYAVMFNNGRFVDFGLSAEESMYTKEQFDKLVELAQKGIDEVFKVVVGQIEMIDSNYS